MSKKWNTFDLTYKCGDHEFTTSPSDTPEQIGAAIFAIDEIRARATAQAAVLVRPVQHFDRDALDTVINEALQTAGDPDKYQSVFAEIIKMASNPERMAPLTGGVSARGIEYIKNSGAKEYFTPLALKGRLKRRKNNPLADHW